MKFQTINQTVNFGVVVIITVQLPLTKPELVYCACSNTACRMSETCDSQISGSDLNQKEDLTPFFGQPCSPKIHLHHQFITKLLKESYITETLHTSLKKLFTHSSKSIQPTTTVNTLIHEIKFKKFLMIAIVVATFFLTVTRLLIL